MRINFVEVEEGKNENWITLFAYIPSHDVNKKYKFEFCGTEVTTNASFTDGTIETIKAMLCEKFGYPHYSIEEAKNALGSHSMMDTATKKWTH